MSKPFGGHKSHAAAVRAFLQQGLGNEEIAHRLNVSVSGASSLISYVKRGFRVQEARQFMREGRDIASLETAVMDLWDAGKRKPEIAAELEIDEDRVSRIVAYMRDGEAERKTSPFAVKTSSAALVSAIERVKPTPIAPKPERALTFQEQLARVASGRARVVPKFEARAVASQTLGGVGSSML